jgi:hypothetical protein
MGEKGGRERRGEEEEGLVRERGEGAMVAWREVAAEEKRG